MHDLYIKIKFITELRDINSRLQVYNQFNSSVLYWHDKNYKFVLPKQLQLGCLQIVHICINRKKNNNNNIKKY